MHVSQNVKWFVPHRPKFLKFAQHVTMALTKKMKTFIQKRSLLLEPTTSFLFKTKKQLDTDKPLTKQKTNKENNDGAKKEPQKCSHTSTLTFANTKPFIHNGLSCLKQMRLLFSSRETVR